MRIAVSGSHCTGKSTLVEALSRYLPGHAIIDEPYHLMAAEGYEFSQSPSIEDFEAQLDRSLQELSRCGADALFDRCPADFLGYLQAHERSAAFAVAEWLPRVHDAMQALDLIVFVPIEAPDRIDVSEFDDFDNSRQRVDEHLREILLEDAFGVGFEVVEVAGSLQARVQAAAQWIESKGDR